MGSSQSKESGIQDYQLWTLTGYIVQTYEDALAKRRSYEDAQNVIMFHLKELSRYALNPKKSPNPDNVYFNGQPQVTIHEKYRHSDGEHAWSLTIQLNPSLRMFKLIHGTPTVRDSARSETIHAPNPDPRIYNTQQTVYPPTFSRNPPRPTRPNQTNPPTQPNQSTQPNQLRTSVPTMSTPQPSVVRSNQPINRTPTNSLQPQSRTTLPAYPALPTDYSGQQPTNFNGSHHVPPVSSGSAVSSNYSNLGGLQRIPVIENDQIAQNLGDFNRSNQLTDNTHIPAIEEEFNLNRFT